MDRELTGTERDALLLRLGVVAAAPTASLLATLQRAWCLTQPFHNLDLLAAHLRGGAALAPDEAIERCIDGLGGPCHVHAAAFLALLRALGFVAHLAPATVKNDADHLGITVYVEGRWFWCDPGNGQPYLRPFPTDAPLDQSHLAWNVHSTIDEATLAVRRRSPDAPAFRRVYVARPRERRSWADFATSIQRHHAEPGFGPFLRGLRVVRMGEERMSTLRDRTLTEYVPGGFTTREIAEDDLAQVITNTLGLRALPVEDALTAWRAARCSA